MNKSYIIFLMLILLSCNRDNDQKQQNFSYPKVVEAKGFVVPKDSMAEPKVILVDESKLKKIPAGKPEVILTNTNVHAAGVPKVVNAGSPQICTPGQDSFLFPRKVLAIDCPFTAGMPEVVIAKDAHIKDNNPQNFSSFGKLQGLKHNSINCMLQDKSGNLWFGTDGGGVSKYDGKWFTNFTEIEGLSNNRVRSIIEDKCGNLWFGTLGGVSKYNGKCFTNFTQKEGLPNNMVFSILQDKSGNIWFGTKGGVCKYDGKWFTNFTTKEGLSSNQVMSILQDNSGNLWFGTVTPGGVSKYDGKCFTNYTDKEGLINNDVISILQDKSGDLWFGTYTGGVSKLALNGAKGSNQYTFTNFTDKEGLLNNQVWSIIQDNRGNLWFGTPGGVGKYDGKCFTNFTDKEGLSGSSVILQDKSGNLWFGTPGGVYKYEGKCFTNFTEKEGLSGNVVFSILQDKSGNIWFGTGRGVSKYDGKCFTNFTKKEGLSGFAVFSILQDKSGNLWFGTNGGGVSKYDGKYFTHFTEKEGLSHVQVLAMIQDRNGALWFGHDEDGGVSKYDGKCFTSFTEKEGLLNSRVYSMLEDKSGNIWFGTNGGGVSKYDGKCFTNFTKKEGLSGNVVLSIIQDKSGNIWFGTNSGGVSKYDGKSFTHYTEKEGLSNNFVGNILLDKSGNLWIGTRFGLNRLKPEMLRLKVKTPELPLFKYYGYEDGFLGIGVTRGKTICEDKSGTIWISSNDRLIAYHPEGDDPDTIPPNIQITGISLFNENIAWLNLEKKKDTSLVLGNGVRVSNFKFDSISMWYNLPVNLSLAYNNNYVTFNYIGITQKQSKKVKYQYKLDGIDKNWSALTSRTEAPYGNLPQGDYTFKVKAMNSEGYWSKEFSYTFTIRPPWWKTWWFRTLLCTIFIISLYAIYRWRTASLRKDKERLERTVDERTAEVVAEKKEVQNQKEEVEKQMKRSNELLLNILPAEVAEELKQKGSAEAKQFDEVTVMFTDFKGFTQISEKLTPSDLVAEIHTCFKAFDHIISKHNIEKIKTIGDSYMCAGGLPVANKTNATDVISAAIEIQQFMEEHAKVSILGGFGGARIGIHTGPVVAGIVGVKKFAYDIWGDTVNIASRMESSGESGKINISESTYKLVKDKFHCTYRGKVQAKNKGEIDMYFVD